MTEGESSVWGYTEETDEEDSVSVYGNTESSIQLRMQRARKGQLGDAKLKIIDFSANKKLYHLVN